MHGLARLVLPGSQPNGCNSMEAGPMKAKRRRASPRDPDDIYRGAELELPYIVGHVEGKPTPWDSEFNF